MNNCFLKQQHSQQHWNHCQNWIHRCHYWRRASFLSCFSHILHHHHQNLLHQNSPWQCSDWWKNHHDSLWWSICQCSLLLSICWKQIMTLGKHNGIQMFQHYVHQPSIPGQYYMKNLPTSTRRSRHPYRKGLYIDKKLKHMYPELPEPNYDKDCINQLTSISKTYPPLLLLTMLHPHLKQIPLDLSHQHPKSSPHVNTLFILSNQENQWDVTNATVSLISSGTASYMSAHHVDKDSLDTPKRTVLLNTTMMEFEDTLILKEVKPVTITENVKTPISFTYLFQNHRVQLCNFLLLFSLFLPPSICFLLLFLKHLNSSPLLPFSNQLWLPLLNNFIPLPS